jgi:hypothetical protein
MSFFFYEFAFGSTGGSKWKSSMIIWIAFEFIFIIFFLWFCLCMVFKVFWKIARCFIIYSFLIFQLYFVPFNVSAEIKFEYKYLLHTLFIYYLFLYIFYCRFYLLGNISSDKYNGFRWKSQENLSFMSEKSLKSSKIEMFSWPPRSYSQQDLGSNVFS